MTHTNRDIWILGSGGIIGKTISASFLKLEHPVVSFSRRFDSYKSGNIFLDFSSPDSVHQILKTQFEHSQPSAIVFCQRFRPTSDELTNLSTLQLCHKGFDVEYSPLFALYEIFDELDFCAKGDPLSLVLLSSVDLLL